MPKNYGTPSIFYRDEKLLHRHHQPEPISMDVHDFNIAVVLQVFPEFGDIHIHTPAVKISITAPYFFKCLFTGEEVVLVFGEHFQQFVFFRRKRLHDTVMA